MSAIDPRFKSTIPASAGVVPFTPDALDPMTAFQRSLPVLEAKERAAEARHLELLRQRDAGEILGTEAFDLLAAAGDAKIAATAEIATRRRVAEAAEAALPPGNRLVFMIKTPTSLERDQLNVRLVSMGLTSVSDEQLRASLIETLYEVNWQQEFEDPELNEEAYADEKAALLDGYWQKEIIQANAFAEWRMQETERLLDQVNGGPVTDAETMPVRLITVREEAQVKLLVDRLMEEPRMRRILGKRIDFSRRNANIMVRLHLIDIEGWDHSTLNRDRFNDALSEEAVCYLRESIVAVYGKAVGDQAWLELVGFIDGIYALEDFERGNSDSPLAKPLDPTGSTGPSGDIATRDGNSTGLLTVPVPADASGMITAVSSTTISGHAATIISNGPTAAA